MNTENFEEEIQLRLLKILGSAETKLTQRELAERMGISVGKTNFCITELAKKGFIEINRFKNSSNKVAYAYMPTPKGLEEKFRLMVHFLSRKLREYEIIQQEIEETRRELSGSTANHREQTRIPDIRINANKRITNHG
jgi:EPS-associated MarR family transcriptional regulator